jgi:integrase
MASTDELPKGLLLRGDTYHLRFMFKGTLIAESTFTKDRREAERVLTKKRAELHQDVMIGGKRVIKFHDAIQRYIKTRDKKGAKASASSTLVHFTKAIDNKTLKKVEMHEAEEVLASLTDEYSPASIKLIRSYWNAFNNWCDKENFNVIGKFKIGGHTYGRIRWLTPEEQTLLLNELASKEKYKGKRFYTDEARKENYDLIVMMLDTGLRFSEAAKINWSQVDLLNKCLYVYRSKGGSPTTLALTNRLYDILIERKKISNAMEGEARDYVYHGKYNKLNNSHVWLKVAAKKAGLSTAQGQITSHVMRHSFASTMIQNGIALNELQHLLGHAKIEMTLRYAHLKQGDATAKAAAILNKQHSTPLVVAQV